MWSPGQTLKEHGVGPLLCSGIPGQGQRAGAWFQLRSDFDGVGPHALAAADSPHTRGVVSWACAPGPQCSSTAPGEGQGL